MKWVLVAALATAGACGRLHFQPAGDAPGAGDGGLLDGELGDSGTGDAFADARVDAASVCQTASACLSCFDDGVTCPATDGTCCACTGAQWQCIAPNPAPCPPTAPMVADGCTAPAGTQCHYDCDAATTWECNGTQWTVGLIVSC
ncbi:MAG TPA: hypothetical protein VM513_26105 [Kofleriaceae bacterium]|nr:hypothetical protein [Kofleriaceae bacterium]